MGALGEVCTITEVAPNAGVKVILAATPATFIGGTDSVAIDLGDYGASKVYSAHCMSMTTTGDVGAVATCTVDSNSSGVIVLSTSAAGTNIYNFIIYAY